MLSSESLNYRRFGSKVAIDGVTAVVAAPGTPSNMQPAAYVYVGAGGAWSEQAKLTAADGFLSNGFAANVAIDGDTVAVGASEFTSSAHLPAVYVFVRSGTAWTQQAKLVPSMAPLTEFIYTDVALDGDTIALGIRPGSFDTGSIHVFTRSGTAWSEQQAIASSDVQVFDGFGHTIALHGDRIVAGAANALSPPSTVTGAVYVFERVGAFWSQTAKIVPADAQHQDAFGSDVDVSGNTLVAGAAGSDAFGFSAGAVYAFVKNGAQWSQQQKFVPPGTDPGDGTGSHVAIDGDRIVVGIPFDVQLPFGEPGAAFAFQRFGNTWSHVCRLYANDPQDDAKLGQDVAIAGDLVIAGAPQHDAGVLIDGGVGAAYVWALGTPFSFCFGDGSTATPCPCAPPDFVPTPSGAAGRGCANSFDSNGARLAVTGSVNTALAFTAEIGPAYSGYGFLVKGDDQDFGGFVSGDGVRCTAGQLIRFGGHNAGTFGAPFGIWSYPNSVQMIPVATATAQAAGERAIYQLVYRNASAGFCSPATTNITNAVRIFWPQ